MELDYKDLELLKDDAYNVKCLDPQTIYLRGKRVSVPCGKCFICEKKRKSSWVLRLTEEIKSSKCAFWLTLTYSDDHLPMFTDVTEDFEGNVTEDQFAVLNKRDYQLFLKSLRKSLVGIKLRYFCVGEYGPTTLRPHYHMLLFLDNVVDYWYMYDLVQKFWINGYFMLKTPTDNHLNYCAKYTISIPDLPSKYVVSPQFMQCSKGIGKSFLTPQMINYYKQLLHGNKTSALANKMVCNGYNYALPRYYKDRIFSLFEKNQISYQIKAKCDRVSEIKRSIYKNVSNERTGQNNNPWYLQDLEEYSKVRRHLREQGNEWRRKQMKKKKI